jgi:hypothetical protein
MAIAFVQAANSGTPSGTNTTKAAVMAAAQQAGSLNVVVINYGALFPATLTQVVSGVADTKTNTYAASTSVQTYTDPSGNVGALVVWAAPNIASATAGANTVTVTMNGAVSFFIIGVLEYSGMATSSPVDVTVSNTGSGTVTATTGPVSTTNANDLLIGGFSMIDGASAAVTYTSRIVQYTLLVEDLIVSSTGSQTATGTSASTNGWAAQLVAFKAAGSGGGGGKGSLLGTYAATGSSVIPLVTP